MMANVDIGTADILVLGATGKTGRRVAERLQDRGCRVRPGSRSADPAFDWTAPEGWRRVLEGVSAVYLAYQPDLAVPGAVETVRAFLAAARAAGVARIVLLSGRGEPEAEDAEALVRASGMDWTILRCSWFCQNFSESFFLEGIMAGMVALPAGLAAEPFVDADDIAEIAVRALEGRYSRKLFEITGPEAISFIEAVSAISWETGREIAYMELSPEAYRVELVRQGVPPEYIDLVLYLFGTVLDGRNTPVMRGVEEALGRPPRSFFDYVRRTAAAGVWGGGHG